MKAIKNFSIVAIQFAFLSTGAFGQPDPEGFGVLNVNNIETRFNTDGTFFSGDSLRYHVPKSGNVSTIAAGALWIGGIDAGGNLKLAAQTYRQTGSDYWPGPLDSIGITDSLTIEQWDRVWKVSKVQVDQHQADFNDNGIIDFPQTAIYEWPAKGNLYAKGKNGVPLVVISEKAPFFDTNGDGTYSPEIGDYPDIKGDEMLWYVFNDNGGLHTQTSAMAIGAEIQISAYGLNCHADNALYNTLFINYKIFFAASLSSAYIGKWIDFDLGCYNDDYVGCDTVSNTFYVYNATAIDPDCANRGYGSDPPVQTVTFLNAQLTSFHYYKNDFTIFGNPETAVHYYNYLAGFWKDNTQVTYGGNGYGGVQPTSIMFPGNPADSTGWSECAVINIPADKKGIGAVGPFTFNRGQTFEMTLAFTTHFLPFNGCPDFTPYRQRIDSIQYKFDNNLLQACTQSNLTCNDTINTSVWTGDANADGVADVYDVLPVGIGYGTTGLTRPNSNTTWTGQPMQDWPQNFVNVGENYKHADCDGSGLIDTADVQPILDNYGMIHFKRAGERITGIPFYLDFQPGFHTAGSTISVPVMLGTSSLQVSDFYGMAFRVSYNTSVVQPGSVTVDLTNSWLGTQGQDMAGIYKELSATGRVDVGVTRTDHLTRAGHGKIATINYILIDDIAGKGDPGQMIQLDIIDAFAISNDETEIELDITSGIEDDIFSSILVYPVPASDVLVVEIPVGLAEHQIQLYDVLGRLVFETEGRSKKHFINIEALQNGIYLLRLELNDNTVLRKVAINH